MSEALTQHPVFHRLPADFKHVASDAERAWLAGFFDGEGTISLSSHGRRGTVKATLSMANTNFDNIDRVRVLLASLTGHDFMPRVQATKDKRPALTLHVGRHGDIRIVLMAINPWLVGKHDQAVLMLRYLYECSRPLNGLRGTRDSAALKERRREFAEHMRGLNKRYAPGEWSMVHPRDLITTSVIRRLWSDQPDPVLPDNGRVRAPGRRVVRHASSSPHGTEWR